MSPEYWITRRSLSSGAHSRDPLAGDDSAYTFAFSRRDASEACQSSRLLNPEGAGNAGRLMRPQPCVQK
jgi:hypothetical protein